MLERYIKPTITFLLEITLIWLFFYTLIDVAALEDDPTFITFLLVFAGLTILLMKRRLVNMLHKKVSQQKLRAVFHRALKLGLMVCAPLGLLFGLMSVTLSLITLTDSVLIVSVVFTVIYTLSMQCIVPKKIN